MNKIGVGVAVFLAFLMAYCIVKMIRADKFKLYDFIFTVAFGILSIIITPGIYKVLGLDDSEGGEITTQVTTTQTDIDYITTLPIEITISTTEPTTEETTKPVVSFRDNKFEQTFTYSEQEYVYEFVAPVTGKYRFDFETSDYECNYRVYLYDSKNQELFSSIFSSKGETRELNEGQTYKLVVMQYHGFPTFTIKVGVPSNKMLIDLQDERK
ncbi:MAG: hypothetical protein E7547_08330 [Ruminococcaceae bacterium]|nr:hypothetical protein [Oscillospiraceae bacterium]